MIIYGITFGEALLQATQFFYSPILVLIVLGVLIIASLAFTYTNFSYIGGSAALGILGILISLFTITLFMSLIIYVVTNGMEPMSWEGK